MAYLKTACAHTLTVDKDHVAHLGPRAQPARVQSRESILIEAGRQLLRHIHGRELEVPFVFILFKIFFGVLLSTFILFLCARSVELYFL